MSGERDGQADAKQTGVDQSLNKQPNQASNEARGKQTEVAVQAHLHALGQGVEKILDGYGPNAILLTPNGSVKGPQAIREYYEDFVRDTLPLLAATYSLQRFDVIGEAAYLTWKAEPSIPMGTDTFLIHQGKIVLHTTSFYMQP